ncbi:MAG: NAD(P)/FAD-dependent oxidoreductase, partial [Clostridiales Family XIII bacterium]|nr:NAD(P)/FAD-dependent oxidoreductase [Clostridiales Family XIII bacterium]
GASRAAANGLKTLLFEEKTLGGACIRDGLLAEPAILDAVRAADTARNGAVCGFVSEGARLDFGVFAELREAALKALQDEIVVSFVGNGVEAVNERVVIKGRFGRSFEVEAAGTVCRAERLLIATGSEDFVPRIEGLETALGTGFALLPSDLPALAEPPERLVVIGSGPAALEAAFFFNAAGSRVTVVELAQEICGALDADAGRILRESLAARGIEFLTGSMPTAFEGGGVRVRSASGVTFVPADKAVVSMGKKPCAPGFGLEKIGVAVQHGAVVTDAQLRTNKPGVWAVGDVNGKLPSAQTAFREAVCAVNDMLGARDSVRYETIPQIVRTVPEAAGVGETELTARVKGLAYEVSQVPVCRSKASAARNGNEGLCKLIIEKGTGRLLGAHLVGRYASEEILAAAFMVGSAWPAETLRRLAFPHMTEGEAIRDALSQI